MTGKAVRLRDYMAKGRRRQRSEGMNTTERKYAEHLELQKSVGLISWWAYQPLKFKLRLADKTYYTPDFMVLRSDELLEIHEVKGFMEDDAAVKLKVAAETFPFPFKLVRWKGKQWEVREV